MSIGLKRGMVTVEPHQSEWELEACRTIDCLRDLLTGTAADIQHVGSTAVKGICAKPIIDIAVGVNSIDDMLSKNDILEANGFVFRGQDIPDQYLYVRGGDDYRTHHIHVVRYGSVEWKNYLNLRDYLNSNEEDARAYSELKGQLAAKYHDDRESYTNAKSRMISDLLIKAAKAKGQYE